MAMMRSYMRAQSSGAEFDETRLARVGLTAYQMKQMYRLLAIAKYDDRFVVPTSHKESHMDVYRSQGSEGFSASAAVADRKDCRAKRAKSCTKKTSTGIWRD